MNRQGVRLFGGHAGFVLSVAFDYSLSILSYHTFPNIFGSLLSSHDMEYSMCLIKAHFRLFQCMLLGNMNRLRPVPYVCQSC